MKQFHQMRYCKGEDWPVHAIVVELGFWDMVQLMIGREIEVHTPSEVVVLRQSPVYEAFNR